MDASPITRLDRSFRFLAKQSPHYARMMRLDRPIGTYLLLWPTLWALWLAADGAHRGLATRLIDRRTRRPGASPDSGDGQNSCRDEGRAGHLHPSTHSSTTWPTDSQLAVSWPPASGLAVCRHSARFGWSHRQISLKCRCCASSTTSCPGGTHPARQADPDSFSGGVGPWKISCTHSQRVSALARAGPSTERREAPC